MIKIHHRISADKMERKNAGAMFCNGAAVQSKHAHIKRFQHAQSHSYAITHSYLRLKKTPKVI